MIIIITHDDLTHEGKALLEAGSIGELDMRHIAETQTKLFSAHAVVIATPAKFHILRNRTGRYVRQSVPMGLFHHRMKDIIADGSPEGLL